MIKAYKNSLQFEKLKRIKKFDPKSWVSVIAPTDDELVTLSRKLKIPLDVLQDAVDRHELPRIVVENDALIIIIRVPIIDEGIFKTRPLTVIFNGECLITVATQELPLLDAFVSQKIAFYTTQQSNFIIKVCAQAIEHYQRYIAQVIRSVKETRAHLRQIDKDDILNLIENEEALNTFVASLTPSIAVMKKFVGHAYMKLYQEDKELIDDLLVDAEQVLELCQTNIRTIRNIRDGYSTVISMRVNQTITILTYVTTFFTIPMVIASVYGMNIRLPFAEHPFAFVYIMLITATLLVALITVFVLFRKKL